MNATVDGGLFCSLIEVVLPLGGWVAVLSHVYLDESGTHDGSPTMTMAGYLFREEQAKRFTRDWARDLKRIGLPCAHMTDCALGFGDNKDMELDQRIESERLLIQHIKRRSLFGFGVSLDPGYYTKTIGDIPGAPSSYSFCILSCVTMVRRWIENTNYDGKSAYFFEAGHRHSNEANRFMSDIPASGPERMNKFAYLSHTLWTSERHSHFRLPTCWLGSFAIFTRAKQPVTRRRGRTLWRLSARRMFPTITRTNTSMLFEPPC